MTKPCSLVIRDEVNARFEGLDAKTRRDLVNAVKFFVPYARHLPAFKLGHWDGTISYAALNGNTFVNVLDKLLPVVMQAGYEVDIQDERPGWQFEFPIVDENYIVDHAPNPVWPKGHPVAGQPIKLRDYQVEVVNQFLNNPQCIQEIATGAGKTLLTATLSHLCETYGRSIVIVPNKSLVEQTESDYKNLGLDVGVFFGERKEFGRTHTICTWQSLSVLEKRTKDGAAAIDIEEFLNNVVCVMVDEVHTAKSDVLKKLLTGPMANIPIRWGLTGTVPKEEYEFMALLCSLGPVVNHLSASELQDKGVLAQCHVNVVQMKDEMEFRSYHEENSYLVTDEERLRWMAKFIEKTSATGNTLVLINRVTTGEQLTEQIKDAVFIHGSVSSADRKETYTDANTNDNMVIVATYGVAAVGINIPRIFNLVLIEPGKSFVRVIQSIGRGIRKAADKDFVQIWDLASTCKFSNKHLVQRKKFYREANYPHTVEKVDYRNDLP